MKTKHILTALALPALFAACTAEDIVNEGAVALQERATVSENFTVKIGEGVESRYAVNGTSSLKFNFETGDKFGAALIDQYNPSYPTKPELWDVIPSLAGNIPFTYDANSGEWNRPADLPLGIGHYLFVYPYNRADVNRAAVSYELPAVQKLYTEEDGEVDLNAAIEAGNKSFYSTVLTEADEELEITLKNLFAYPKFVINFDNGEKVTTVSKVVLAKKGGFEVKGGFNHEAVAALFANDKTTDFYDKELEATDWNKVQTADLLTTDANYAKFETSPYLVAELPLNAEVEEVTNNKVIEVRFMIPGVLMESTAGFNNYSMYIYTDNGVYAVGEDGNFAKAISWKSTTKDAAKKAAFARGTANTITINKKYVEKASEEKYIVTSIADWDALVEEYGDIKNHTVEIEVVGSLTLDETAEMPSKATFKVTDLAVNGEVELCNVDVETLTVNESATLTTCTTLVAGKIINNGEVVVAAAYDKDGDAIACENIDVIANNGTLTVEKNAIASFALTNDKKAVFTNEGEVEIEGGESAGDIVNNGDITFTDDFEVVENKDKWGNPLTSVENNGKILSAAELENNGLIINDGTMTCRHKIGEINNNGYIDSRKNAVTYITDNKGTVQVYAVKLADYVTVENKNGTILFETEGSVDFVSGGEASIVNTVNAVGDLAIKNLGNVRTININENTSLSIEEGGLETLNVNEDVVVASSMTVENLNVAEEAVAHIPADYVLAVTSSLNNKGTIEAYGKLNLVAAEIKEGEEGVGKIEENGSKGEVEYYSDRESNIQRALKEFIADAPEYEKDDFTIKLVSFQAHLSRVVTSNKAKYPYGWICKEYSGMTQSELNKAAAGMYTSKELSDLVAELKTWSFEKNANLFDYKVTVAEGKTTAYEAFKNTVKTYAYNNNKDNVKHYAVTNLNGAQIDEVLKNKYAYIWKGCELYALTEVWKSYKNFDTGNNDYAANCADGVTLIGWIEDVLNADTNKTPAIGQIQTAIANLGITAANYEYYRGYTDAQVAACCGVEPTTVAANTAEF